MRMPNGAESVEHVKVLPRNEETITTPPSHTGLLMPCLWPPLGHSLRETYHANHLQHPSQWRLCGDCFYKG